MLGFIVSSSEYASEIPPQAFVDEDVALRLYCISHCALDVTDERLALTKRVRFSSPQAKRC